MLCPCGSAEPFESCCARLHSGEVKAATAEQLMRSRFSAFAVGDSKYLLATWHPSTRPRRLRLDPDQRWTRLEIVSRAQGGPFDQEGTVEFRAHGSDGVLHETSRFVRESGGWLYVDGTY